MQNLAGLVAIILGVIAIFHAMWGLKIWWPASNEATLARTVTGFKGMDTMPAPYLCFGVTACLLVSIALTLAIGGWISLAPAPPILITIATAGVAAVFLGRGLIGFTAYWAKHSPEQPFRKLDKWLYSPLCLSIAGSLIALLAT